MKKNNLYAPSLIFLTVLAVFAILLAALPKADYSMSEKRALASPPSVSWKALADGTFTDQLESYVSDHFPFRDAFVSMYAYYELATGRGGAADIYHGRDGYLIAAPAGFSTEHVTTNVLRYAAFAERQDLPATLMIVPSTGYIMDDKLPRNHREYTDDAMFDAAVAAKGDMAFLDLREPFAATKDTVPLYYKTDHHLTSAGAYEMYKAYAAAKGLTPVTPDRTETVEGFYGTGYSRSGYRFTDPDTIELWHDDDLQVEVAVYESGTEPIKTSDSVFFPERLEEADKYPVFLDGNHPLVTIRNPAADGGRLLIIKDSFAHCFTGFLASHYSEIVMVDLRYYRQSVSELTQAHAIDEVLFLYGTENLSTESFNSGWLEE